MVEPYESFLSLLSIANVIHKKMVKQFQKRSELFLSKPKNEFTKNLDAEWNPRWRF